MAYNEECVGPTDEELGLCLHGMFREQAKKTPNVNALIGRSGTVSYKELDEASDQLAAMLIRMGVKKNSCVAIFMERCSEYALSYIGILKAGGGYLPLDVAYPDTMVSDVLLDSTPAVVICKQRLTGRLPASQPVIILDPVWNTCLHPLTDADRQALAAVDEKDLSALAYIVYSSGTTGKPKGIACPHRGAVFSYKWRYEAYPYTTDKQEVEACNVFFVWEMCRPLLRGHSLCVIPDDVIYDPPTLTEFLQEMHVTRMLFTPSLLEAVLDTKAVEPSVMKDRLKSMQMICLCGEVVTVTLQERVKEIMPWAKVLNLYSVSEVHDVAGVDLKGLTFTGRKYCPVGKLLKGVEAYVLDDNLNPRPLGEVGELYVAGVTLARGYVGLDKLTQERFPTIRGKRMYKTGDNARVLPSRELEILGRCDSMVKVRGYSVELKAIESIIMNLTDLVSSCIVLVQGEEGKDKFVIAYVVMRNAEASILTVRLALKERLPHYMVPAYIIDLPFLPTHEVSGKLDKSQLPKVDPTTGTIPGRKQQVSDDCTPPQTEMQKKLHSIWCDIMNMRQIDVKHDSFFDIGGHSLLAAKLVQRVGTDLGKKCGVVDLFLHATIESLATFLDGSKGAAGRVIDLGAEVELYDTIKYTNDIAMRAFWRSRSYSQVRARTAFITGATGFLGSFLLHELLKNHDIDVVYCIVRATTLADAKMRLQETMHARGLWSETAAAKTQVLVGDVALHHLGLEDDDFAALSTGVDIVYHCSALVNLVYPYEGLRAPNVVGTRNVLEFALAGKVKRMVHISTDGIFPDGLKDVAEDIVISGLAPKLTNGYSQSKWVAEELVRKAMDRGLPAIIFRPGNMGGKSGTALWNPSDFNFLVLAGCLELDVVPAVKGWTMEMTPVDVAADGIIKISGEQASLGKTFHVTNFSNCLSAEEYFDICRKEGYTLETVSLEEWRKRVLASSSPSMQKLRDGLHGGAASSEADLQALATCKNAGFEERCKAHDIVLPHIGVNAMSEYIRAWQVAGLVKSAAKPLGRALLGKVALVTGASSGIGAAIARALSAAGAHVGVGARRIDGLKKLVAEMDHHGGGRTQNHACEVDVTNREQVENFVAQCEQFLGPIDIFVSNAGVMHYTRLEHLQEEQWHKEVDVNIKGLLHCTAAMLPRMLSRNSGHIVVTTSDAGRHAFPGLSVYSGTKFFQEAFCQGLRKENADRGLRVTTIQPGDCKTELSALTTNASARSEFSQSSQERQFWLDPEDVASAVVYAVSAPAHVAVNEILIEPRGAPA